MFVVYRHLGLHIFLLYFIQLFYIVRFYLSLRLLMFRFLFLTSTLYCGMLFVIFAQLLFA